MSGPLTKHDRQPWQAATCATAAPQKRTSAADLLRTLEAVGMAGPRRSDPFAMQSPMHFDGMRVLESPDRPRYTLPAEVIPGVPWPPGFRDKINTWSHSFLGTTNVVPRGQYLVLGNHTLIARREDVVKLMAACV